MPVTNRSEPLFEIETYSPLSDANESLNHTSPLPDGSYAVIAVYLGIITVYGSLLNAFVLFVFVVDNQLRTPINLILVNLAVSDLIIALVGGTMSVVASWNRGWNLGETLCVAYAFGMSLAGIVSITTLSTLALWRCMVVVFPLSKNHLDRRKMLCVTFIIWVYSVSVTCPPVLGWGHYGLETAEISCSVEWENRDFNSRSFIIYMFVTGLFIPIAVMTVSYGCILRTVRRSHRLARGSRCRDQRRISVMVAAMISSFLVAWTPYAAFALTQSLASGENLQLTPISATIPSLFAKSSVIFNPLIYCCLNTQFHAACRRLFRTDSGRIVQRSNHARFAKPLPRIPPQVRATRQTIVMRIANHRKPTGTANSGIAPKNLSNDFSATEKNHADIGGMKAVASKPDEAQSMV